MWSPELQGKIILDNSFDLSSVEAQQYLFNFCNTTLDNQENVWIFEFKNWVETKLGQVFPVENEYEFN